MLDIYARAPPRVKRLVLSRELSRQERQEAARNEANLQLFPHTIVQREALLQHF